MVGRSSDSMDIITWTIRKKFKKQLIFAWTKRIVVQDVRGINYNHEFKWIFKRMFWHDKINPLNSKRNNHLFVCVYESLIIETKLVLIHKFSTRKVVFNSQSNSIHAIIFRNVNSLKSIVQNIHLSRDFHADSAWYIFKILWAVEDLPVCPLFFMIVWLFDIL